MIVVQILLQVQLEIYWEQNREDAELSQGVKVNQFEATKGWKQNDHLFSEKLF